MKITSLVSLGLWVMIGMSIVMGQSPGNDDLCDAEMLYLGDYCEFPNGDLAGATLEAGEPVSDCLGGGMNTVWYAFEAPGSGWVIITTETAVTGSLNNSALTLYGLPGGRLYRPF